MAQYQGCRCPACSVCACQGRERCCPPREAVLGLGAYSAVVPLAPYADAVGPAEHGRRIRGLPGDVPVERLATTLETLTEAGLRPGFLQYPGGLHGPKAFVAHGPGRLPDRTWRSPEGQGGRSASLCMVRRVPARRIRRELDWRGSVQCSTMGEVRVLPGRMEVGGPGSCKESGRPFPRWPRRDPQRLGIGSTPSRSSFAATVPPSVRTCSASAAALSADRLDGRREAVSASRTGKPRNRPHGDLRQGGFEVPSASPSPAPGVVRATE